MPRSVPWRFSWCRSGRSASPTAIRLFSPDASGGPTHQIVDALVFLNLEPKPPIKPHRRIVFLDMNRDVFTGGGGFLHEVAQQRFAKSPAAMLRQEGDVDDAVLGRPALDVETSDILTGVARHQPVSFRIIFLVMRM